MEEDDPYMPFRPIDRYTSDEFFARNNALSELLAEAIENLDEAKQGIYQEAIDDLRASNPGEGRYHRAQDCSPTVRPLGITANLLDRFGLVGREGLSEFGLKQVGWGIPLHSRRKLEESRKSTANYFSLLRHIENTESRQPED